MNNNITRKLLLICVGIFLFGSGYRVGQYNLYKKGVSDFTNVRLTNTNTPTSVNNLDFSLFWDTWDKLQQKYVDHKKVVPQKMLYGAIKGMVASVDDPYTFFLTPEENKQTKDDLGGKFEGIGAQLGLKDKRIVVIAPLKSSPAEAAGVRAGDFINKVDGAATKSWTLIQAVNKIRGPQGSKVKLTLERAAKEFDVTIERKQILVSSVEVSYDKAVNCTASCPQVAVVKLTQFGDNTNEEWDNMVDQVVSKYEGGQIKALVLDLRDNPGGFLESSVYVASEFVPQGSLVVKQESSEGVDKEYKVDRQGRLLTIPLIVLINQGSASASEILSGALRDHKRTQLVGVKSFGKGSVQEALDLKEGAGLHVTVAKWILPSGEWINGKGIEPEIKVENKVDQANTTTRQSDAQLEKAIETVLQ